MNHEQMSQKVEKIAKKLELRDLQVIDFLVRIAKGTGIDSGGLIKELGLPRTQLYKLIGEFAGIIDPTCKEEIRVKEEEAERMKSLVEPMKTGYLVDKSKIKEILQKYSKDRPKPDRDLDQFTATVETTVRRVVEMAKNGDLMNRSIAFLGDDDLTSVATALTSQPIEIFVFEIDQRLTDLIQKISNDNKLNIQVIKQDLRQPIDRNFYGKFDTIFTDPPYTPLGINTFLNQAINLINQRLLSRIYLCYGNSDRAREREVEIQKLLIDHNLLIKDKMFRFNQYSGAGSIGSTSSLYTLDWTPRTKISNLDSKKLYTNE